MAEILEFADWLEIDEDFGDVMRAGVGAVGRGLNYGLQKVDQLTGWIDKVAASVPDIHREVVLAHREIREHPELEEVMQNKASIMDLMRKLAQVDPKKLEAEGKAILGNKDAGQAIAAWERSAIPLAVELIIQFGEAIHIGKLIRAMPSYFGTMWEKFNQIKQAATVWQKTEAILALVGAFLTFLHFAVTSAFLSGLMAKIAALLHQWMLGGKLLAGAYIVWGLVILLAMAHGNTKSRLLRWVIGFVLAIIDPSHGKIDDVKASPRFRKFFGMKPAEQPNQNPAEAQPQQTQQESTLQDLHQSAVDAFPRTTKRQHAVCPVRIVQMEWVPFIGVKTLYIKGLAQNSISGKEYNPQILFKNILYNTNADTRIIASDGLMYEYKKPSVVENDVLVRCTCPDFRWRFAYYNHLDHSLHGRKPPKYNSLGVGPPANPLEMEGMCKHLMKLVTALRDADAIK
jgi:hypothetical protein